MTTPEQQAVATAAGILNVPAIAAAADTLGLDFAAALALIQMESGGANIYGHDKGGVYTLPGDQTLEVTEANFAPFLARVMAGETSNGVGPCQITYAGTLRNGRRDGGYFTQMLARDLKPWDPTDNARFGFELIAANYTRWDSWESAGAHYNGGTNPGPAALDYGRRFAALVTEWQTRLAQGGTMPTSQNGWTATPDLPIVPLVVNGVGFLPGVRAGDVATVLGYVAQQVNDRVEKAVNPGCWGFYYRPNRNDPHSLSNHSSGTAIDFNAPKHPNGVAASRTWTTKQRAEIHKILAEVDGAVRWGGDYTKTPDAMHFEINCGPVQLAAVAKKVRSLTSLPTKPGGIDVANVREQFANAAAGREVFTLPGVRRIQELLNGKYHAGLDTDGFVGAATLNAYGAHEAAIGAPKTRVPNRETLASLVAGTVYYLIPRDKPKPADPPPVEPPAVTYRSAQCNVQGTDPIAQTSATIDAVMAQADVVVWNELSTLDVQNYLASKVDGWAHYMPGYAPGLTHHVDSAQVSISWRTDVFTQDGDGVSTKTNGGVAHVTPSRYINRVPLRLNANGKRVWRQGTHVVHHIEVGGLPRLRGAITGQNARARNHFAMLAADTIEAAKTAPVDGSGDLNVDLLAEKALVPSKRCPWFPKTVLEAAGCRLVGPLEGTHGGRLIDWRWTKGPISRKSGAVLPRGTSDHNAVLLTLELT